MPAFDPKKYVSGGYDQAKKTFDPVAYAKGDYDTPAAVKSGEEVKKEPTFLDKAIGAVGRVSNAIDSYTMAPVRAGIGSLQKGEGIKTALQKAANQSGEDPSRAPTNEDLAAGFGIPRSAKLRLAAPQDDLLDEADIPTKEFNPAAVVGFAADVATDPLNYVPMGPLATKVGKIATKTTQAFSSPIAKSLNKLAEERALKTAIGNNVTGWRKVTKTTLNKAGDVRKSDAFISKAGRDIIEEGGILSPLSKVEDMAPRLGDAADKYGKMIGSIVDEVDRVSPNSVSSSSIASKIRSYAEDIPETRRTRKLKEALFEEAEIIEKKGNISFREAHDLKQEYPFKATDADALTSDKKATNKIKKFITDEMDDKAEAVAKMGSPESKALIDQYKNARSKYATFENASSAATEQVSRNRKNRWPSPSDYGVGVGAGLLSAVNSKDDESMLQNILYGVLGGAANKFARTRGSSLASSTANQLAKVANKSPQFAKAFGDTLANAAKAGPKAFVATHHYLMKSDPEYKKMIEEKDNDAMKRRLEKEGK